VTRRKRIIWSAGIAAVVVLVPVIAHYRAKAAAEKFKAQLRAQGEMLSIAELIPMPPLSGPNGATAFLDALSRLTTFDYEIQPGVMKMVQPGRARIVWQQATLPTEKSENIWPVLRAHLETNRVSLEDLREAIGQPLLQFRVNYHQTFSALLPHLAPMKSASQRLSAATVMAMRDMQTDEAFRNLKALIELPAHHREEPFIISQLVRGAIVAIAANTAWEALHYPHWSDDQLGQLQSAWEAVQMIPQMERALAMERACGLVEYAMARDSLNRLGLLIGSGGASNPIDEIADVGNKILEDPGEGLEAFMDRFPRRWVWKWWNSYDDEVWYLQGVQRSLSAARAATNGQAFVTLQQQLKAEASRIGEAPRQFLFARMLGGDSHQRAVERAVVAQTQCRIVATAIALRRFELRFGKLPQDLKTLAPEFLSAVPLDPMNAQPLRYRVSNSNSFVLYSVGLDGVDGDGDTNPRQSGSRNLYWTQCKDFVWPQPATAAQVREFNSQLEQKPAGKRR
jgi:hypothetical protein